MTIMFCEKCEKHIEEKDCIKKFKLCKKCYQQMYRNRPHLKKVLSENEINHLSEIEFIKNYFKHGNWIYQPATFVLKNTTYSPDFYDGENNCFIECVGTRQAYSLNKDKYKLFREIFPKIKFELRATDGKLYPNKYVRDEEDFENEEEKK